MSSPFCMRSDGTPISMNAIIREKYEAHVLTYDAIEVHLTYIRSGLDAMQATLPVLRDKIDQLSIRADAKLEKADEGRASGDATLGVKIDKAVEKLAASDAALGVKIDNSTEKLDGKIDKLTDVVSKIAIEQAKIQGQMKTMLLLLSMAGIVASGVSIAHTFEWI